jgi:hypothetical protein
MRSKKTDSLRQRINRHWKLAGKTEIHPENWEFCVIVLRCLEQIAETERSRLQKLAESGDFTSDNTYIMGQITYWARAASAYKWASSILLAMHMKGQ